MRDETYDLMMRTLDYDQHTGVFTWKVPMARGRIPAGTRAGCNNCSGYVVIRLGGKLEFAHRLAWLYVHGKWPGGDIDHKNGIRSDNRMENLRDVPHRINRQNERKARVNSKSGLLGVHPKRGRWAARLWVAGRSMSFGSYATPEEAHQVYLDAKRRFHAGCTI